MKKLRLLLLSLLAAGSLHAQAPIVLSVADVLDTYGLDSALVADTANAMAHLDSLPQDYVALTNLCVSLRTKAQHAISSLENDYRRSDSLIWIDSNVVVADYAIYGYRLRAFADLMGRQSIRFARLEQQRVEQEKEAARQRAIEEQQRQQAERNREAETLKQAIDHHHRAIISACDGHGITDKIKLKELKDLYYSYLMVYNKYDLATSNASPRLLSQLDELNNFQNDLLDNILGNNSLPSQIENFKNILKARCEKENTDIFRSYSRVFKQTSVPISFADLKEYADYTSRLRSIIAVQQRYMQTIDLRSVINQNSDNIQRLYSKKYRDVANAYKETSRSVNTLPAFTTHAESISFIKNLEEFIEAQQVYIESYDTLEAITHLSDTIVATSQSAFRDVAAAYRDLKPALLPIPSFKNPRDAEVYLQQLQQVRAIQKQYLRVIDLRDSIRINQDSINAHRRTDRTLWLGCRQLQEQIQLTPSFTTTERGEAFIASLASHVANQQLALRTFERRTTINANANKITGKSNPYRNIAKAYQRMEKGYEGISDIVTLDDLRRYNRQCDAIDEMQQAFLRLIQSDIAADSDNKLRRETDLSKIRIILGL